MAADPAAVLRASREQAIAIASKGAGSKLRAVLQKAEADLAERLRTAQGVKGPGLGSFTATQMEATLRQVRAVLADVKAGIQDTTLAVGSDTAHAAAKGAVDYLQASEQRFKGIGQRLPLNEAMLFDRSIQGTRSSILNRLQSDPKKGPGILARYGDGVIQHFEGVLQQRFAAGVSWDDTRNRLIAGSPFLQEAPAHWAERIVRTEIMGAHNRASWEALRDADAQIGGMVKILCATFDDRTAADSYAVHGQIRRPEEAFETWQGLVQHPPARPNDREVVVPHRIDWPLPASLAWRTDAQVHARYIQMGGKGAPPPRPKMTTVDLSLFGKPSAAPIQEPAAIPERKTRAAQATPFFDENPAPFTMPAPTPVLEPPSIMEPQLPLAMPKPKKNAPLTDTQIMGEFISPPTGSNKEGPGGLYEGTDGVKRYVKFYADPSQAYAEHLANQIYNDLGIGAPTSTIFEHGGKLGYASEIRPGETLSKAGITPEVSKKILDGFAADALIGNWDAVGLVHDNVLVHEGKPTRIDTGGSFLFRAQGTRKTEEQLSNFTEWDVYFSPKNPAYREVAHAAGVKSAEQIVGLKKQIEKIEKLQAKAGGWEKYVDKYAGNMNEADKARIVEMLDKRTLQLADKAKTLPDKVVKEKPAKLPKGAITIEKFHSVDALPAVPLHKDLPRPVGVDDLHGTFLAQARAKMETLRDVDFPSFDAMKDYTATSYGKMRDTHRLTREEWYKEHGRYPSDFDRYAADYAKLDRAFDHPDAEKFSALAHAPESQVDEVWRGIKRLPKEVFEKLLNAKTMETKAMISTAWQPSTAHNFAREASSGYSVIFHFTGLKGTKGKMLSVETHSSTGGESEILLRHGMHFKVKGITRTRGYDKTATVELEYVPDKARATATEGARLDDAALAAYDSHTHHLAKKGMRFEVTKDGLPGYGASKTLEGAQATARMKTKSPKFTKGVYEVREIPEELIAHYAAAKKPKKPGPSFEL